MSSMNVSILVSIAFVLDILLQLLAQTMQPESLQSVANAAMDVVNARGSPIDVRLQDIPARVQGIALHGVCHGAVVALTTA